mgnify:FL=1
MDFAKLFLVLQYIPALAGLILSAEAAFSGRERGPEKRARVVASGVAVIDGLKKSNVIKAGKADELKSFVPVAVDSAVALMNLIRAFSPKSTPAPRD